MPASGRGAIKRQQLRATKRRKIEASVQRPTFKREREREWHDPLSQRDTAVTSSSRPATGPNWPECSVRQLSIRLIINYIDAAAFELIPPLAARPRGARRAAGAQAFRDTAPTSSCPPLIAPSYTLFHRHPFLERTPHPSKHRCAPFRPFPYYLITYQFLSNFILTDLLEGFFWKIILFRSSIYMYVCMEYFELVNAAYVTNGRGRVCTRDEYHGARDFVRFIQRGTGGDV